MAPAGQSRRSHDFFCLWLVLGANLWQKQFEKNQPIQNLRHRSIEVNIKRFANYQYLLYLLLTDS